MKRSAQHALIADGSALFYTSRVVGDNKPLDYRRLDELVRHTIGIQSFDARIFFTAFDPANEGQAKFLDFIAKVMGWDVEAVPVPEAVVPPPTVTTYEGTQPRSYIRFDSRIAFALGRLAGVYDKVLVISDSYALSRPIQETVARGSSVTLAFFRQCLDPRWNKLLREHGPDGKSAKLRSADGIDLIDLDKHVDQLFGLGARPIAGDSAASGLRRLP